MVWARICSTKNTLRLQKAILITQQVHADAAKYSSRTTKQQVYDHLIASAEALFQGQRNWVCNLANTASLLWYAHEHMSTSSPSFGKPKNWTGFYVRDAKSENDSLILGPFMGKVACQEIPFGKGVCGAAAQERRTVLVPDVEQFPGHIACDSESQSEIVVPILDADGQLRAIIDIDCQEKDGFDEADQKGLERLAKLLSESCDW